VAEHRALKLAFKLVVSAALVAFLVYKVEWHSVVQALVRIDAWLFVFSTLTGVCGVLTLAGKYAVLTRGTVVERSVWTMFRINFITRFYALFLPSALGTEAVRWLKVTGGRTGRSLFLASTVFERSSFVVFLMATGLAPIFLYPPDSEVGRFMSSVVPVVLAALVGGIVVMSYLIFRPLQGITARLVGKGRLGEFVEKFSLSERPASVYAKVFLLGALWHGLYVLRMYLLVLAMGIPLGAWEAAWMGSLVLMLQTLPLSFSGIGVREGAYAYLFTLMGLGPELGVLLGLLFFSQMLLYALTGGALELSGR
jgi:uncharacterized membrane protein YbhN (UPF0104 family)